MAASVSNPSLFPHTRRFLYYAGRELKALMAGLGLIVLYTMDILRFLVRGRLDPRHFFEQAAFVGNQNLGVALVMTTFSGMVIALQVATEMVKQGGGNFVGALVSLAMLRELAPIMTGFSVIAMSGSAFAAELSTMKITSQIDALKVLHVHPVRYLVVPRVAAATVMLPLMTVITAVAGILGGMFISDWLAGLNPDTYLESVWSQTALKDVWGALLKAGVFGYVIAMIATTIGINATGGSRDVGVATTRAVVWAFVAMAICDYLLTYIIYGGA